MAKKSTLRVDFTEELDFSLTGISCGFKDYRLCFDLNRALDLGLSRTEDLVLPLGRPGSSTVHSCFRCPGSDGELYYLISNRDKNGSGYFVPEHKNLTYFFVISGEGGKYLRKNITESIRDVHIVEAAYEVPLSTLKSLEAFLFLFEI